MGKYIIISPSTIPKILDAFKAASKSIESIERCACEDFRSTKSILDRLQELDISQILSSAANHQFSEIVSELQYVDVLQQRLAHIVSTTNLLERELCSFGETSSKYTVAYRQLIRLNLKQFQDAIDIYLNTTDAIHYSLNEVSKNHKMLFLHISGIKLLYKYNIEILRESYKVREVYNEHLLKYNHPSNPLAIDCVEQVKDIASVYTMEQERLILDSFLKVDMEYEQGYDADSDTEKISLF